MKKARVAVAVLSLSVFGPSVSAQSYVTGTALYRERIALPADAILEVTLEDVSRADAKADVISRVTLNDLGQPPFAFKIGYDPARINPRMRYAVRARITQAGRLLFITDQSYPVLTSGGGSTVSMVLRQVPHERAPYFGNWRVTSYKIPGISAMTSKQAAAWVGTAATYRQDLASFGRSSCANPSYESRSVSAEQFTEDYRVTPKALGVEGGSLTLVTVTCRPTEWTNRGSLLIVKSPNALLTTWDGVFFELARRVVDDLH